MWPFSPDQALEGIKARLERLETAPVLALAPEEIEAYEPLQARVLVIESVINTMRSHGASIRELNTSVEDLSGDLASLKLAVAEGIERVDRAERRIRASVRRARKELLERGLVDDGLEAEDAQLREADGDGGDDDGLQLVQEELGQASDEASSIRGVSLEALRRGRYG